MTSSSPLLWWRWSWRDLRQRWLSVVAIALVIAIGTGVYAGLGSSGAWARQSYDASFAALGMHDLKVALSPGTTAPAGDLERLMADLPASRSGDVTSSAVRLVVPSQIDIPTDEGGVFVRALVLGADDGGPDAVDVTSGRRPVPGAEVPEVVLERKFADYHDLPEQGSATLAGGAQVDWVGKGLGPEYFYIVVDGQFVPFAESAFAVVFTSLVDAQRITGLAGQANEIVLQVAPGADRDAIAAQLTDAIAEAGTIGARVSTREEDPSWRLLYDDLEGDQQVWTALTALILAAAAIAAFNLVGRVVDAQRREIGVQMALGVPRRVIVRRPIVMAAQVALAGVVLGVVVGVLVGNAMRDVFASVLPLPEWQAPFQPAVFARAAVIGFAVPFVASIVPIRRVLRMEPVAAIHGRDLRPARPPGRLATWWEARSRRRTDHRRTRTSVSRLPVRNTVRNLRRSLLTAAGVGVAVATMVAVLGMLDSMLATTAAGEAELLRANPDRLEVTFDGFVPVDGPTVAGLDELSTVAAVEPQVATPAQVRSGEATIDMLITIMDLGADDATARWTPTLTEQRAPVPGDARPGLVVAAKALEDLGVDVGDGVSVRHLRQEVAGVFTTTETEFVITGVHAEPLRPIAYVDDADVAAFGLEGSANSAVVTPRPGASAADVGREAFVVPGVALVQAASATAGVLSDALGQFIGFFAIAAGAVVALALLVAFNSAAIAADERRREHATLFAFGLPVRSVLGVLVAEGVIVGIAATIIGLAVGYLLVGWMVRSILATTVPEIGLAVVVTSTPLIAALVVGVAAVALAPLLVVRRLTRMSIPDALRVME